MKTDKKFDDIMKKVATTKVKPPKKNDKKKPDKKGG